MSAWLEFLFVLVFEDFVRALDVHVDVCDLHV